MNPEDRERNMRASPLPVVPEFRNEDDWKTAVTRLYRIVLDQKKQVEALEARVRALEP